jgi:hypothetical protein
MIELTDTQNICKMQSQTNRLENKEIFWVFLEVFVMKVLNQEAQWQEVVTAPAVGAAARELLLLCFAELVCRHWARCEVTCGGQTVALF